MDLRKGNLETEKEIHALIPLELYHYGEWCVWNKKIAQIWLRYYRIDIKDSLEDYFYKRNKLVNKAIVKEYKNSIYLNFIRYFSKESNLDLSEPDNTAWRTP